MIPSGWQYYPLSLFANAAAALAQGIPAPAEKPQGVWLPPAVFARLCDPDAAARIARQEGGCTGCGG